MAGSSCLWREQKTVVGVVALMGGYVASGTPAGKAGECRAADALTA